MIASHLSSIAIGAAPALANHLWQSTAFAATAWLVTLLLRNNQARIRYALWMAASIKFLIPFSLLITLGTLLPKPRQIAPPAIIYSAIDTATRPFPEIAAPIVPTPTPTPNAHLTAQLPAALAILWLCGALTVLLIWLTRWCQVHAALKKSIPITAGREHEILRRLETQSNKKITLLRSPELMEPGIFGIFRPTLLWPHRLSDQLEDQHIEAILTHEAVHVQRRDNLTAALHMLVESIFWFHPIVWWIESRMIEERERACDEAVLQQGGSPETYAESLLKACRFCLESPLPCISGITGADLSRRVRSIMTLHLEAMSLGKKLVLTSLIVVTLAGPVAFGIVRMVPAYGEILHATGPLPSFEVATIRPSNPDATDKASMESFIRISSNNFTAKNQTVKELVEFAYNIQLGSEYRVIADQNWINTNRYNIEAKQEETFVSIASNQKMDQIRLMVQSLLADRFKLKINPGTKQLPAYALVLAKSGPKLTASTYTAPPDAPHPPTPIGGVKVGSDIFVGVATTSSQLADALARQPEVGGRPVLDQTGLKGNYDFTLKWSPDRNVDAASAQSADPNPPSGPSLFTALQEQLGLKLQPTKGPVEVLVIAHIEQPTGDPGGEAPPTQSKSTPAATPSFEVTTIKPSKDPSGDSDTTFSGNRYEANNKPLIDLIRSAYGITASGKDQLVGAPTWVNSTNFDIRAKLAEADYAELQKLNRDQQLQQMQLLLQSLLAERFNLKIHHETKELPMYTLTVAKGGSKLSSSSPAPTQKQHGVRAVRGQITGIDTNLDTFSKVLSMQSEVGRQVVDKTGLTGTYNFALQWTPESSANADAASGPSLFTALQEQLGLKLESTKGPVDVVVIDSIAMPSSN